MRHHVHAPFQFDLGGRTASVDLETHVRQLIDMVLMTSPGERINRPGFGAGLYAAVFSPAADDLFTAARFLVEGALQQWVGDLVDIEDITVDGEDATLRVSIAYRVRATGVHASTVVTREAAR